MPPNTENKIAKSTLFTGNYLDPKSWERSKMQAQFVLSQKPPILLKM